MVGPHQWGGEAVEIVSDSGVDAVRYGGHDGYVMSKFITDAQPDPIRWGYNASDTTTGRFAYQPNFNALKTKLNAFYRGHGGQNTDM